MNKNRGIWIAIISILVIGIGITWTTNSVIRKKSEVMDTKAAAYDAAFSAGTEKLEEGSASGYDLAKARTEAGASDGNSSAAESGPGTVMSRSSAPLGAAANQAEEESAGKEKMVSGQMPKDGGTPDEGAALAAAPYAADEAAPYAAAAEAGAETQADTVSGAGVAITPLEPAAGSPQVYQSVTAGTYDVKRLAEVDAQIQKMRSESSDPSTYTVQVLADQELKLWKEELGVLYSTIYEGLDEDGKEVLETSQQTWYKDRDKKAETAARKYSGGSLEGVEYTASMAESTRQRAYDLAGEYAYVLSPSDEG